MRKFLKFFSLAKIKIAFLLLLLFTLYIGISAYSYVVAVSSDIADSVFRLHILANSDSKEDQDLKYMVRDAVIDYMDSLTSESTTKQQAIAIAQEHQNEFKEIAEQVIKANGYSYSASIEIGNFDFPTKTYGDISLPAGKYDALRIKIGEAQGQNWWCVMFPPLCFVDVSSGIVPEESKSQMQDSLSEEEYQLVSEGNSEETANSGAIQFKFKLVEWLQSVPIFTAKN